jgi:hypothetical protein
MRPCDTPRMISTAYCPGSSRTCRFSVAHLPRHWDWAATLGTQCPPIATRKGGRGEDVEISPIRAQQGDPRCRGIGVGVGDIYR